MPSPHVVVHGVHRGQAVHRQQAVRAVPRAAVDPRRRWYFSDRESVRTPARYSAEATLSPSSNGTDCPSNSNDATPQLTSFVRVSRVRVVQVLHPMAWNQRSRCGPSGFSGR